MVLEINELINSEPDPKKRTILKKLRKWNKEAYLFWTCRMDSNHPGRPYKQARYRALQRTESWKEAKKLLQEY